MCGSIDHSQESVGYMKVMDGRSCHQGNYWNLCWRGTACSSNESWSCWVLNRLI